MNSQDERTRRWLAYFLDEAAPEERERIEAELAASPEEAGQVKRLVEGVSQWAKAPVPHTPLRMDELPVEIARPGAAEKAGGRPPRWRWSWAWVAAAVFVLALTQARFSITAGGVTFNWGREETPAQLGQIHEDVQRLAQQLDEVQQAGAKNQEEDHAVALRHLLLERDFQQATDQLARNQRIEAVRRYQDTQSLLRLAGFERSAVEEWQ